MTLIKAHKGDTSVQRAEWLERIVLKMQPCYVKPSKPQSTGVRAHTAELKQNSIRQAKYVRNALLMIQTKVGTSVRER